jgi:hypothetical protein
MLEFFQYLYFSFDVLALLRVIELAFIIDFYGDLLFGGLFDC